MKPADNRVPVSPVSACDRYREIAGRLPSASFPENSRVVANLGELIADIDVFVLDGFGVLNVGAQAVPGAADRVAQLTKAGCQVFVITNGSTNPVAVTEQKYHELGIQIDDGHVVSSRDALAQGMASFDKNMHWGFAAPAAAKIGTLAAHAHLLGEQAHDYAKADGFVLLSSRAWDDQKQALLVDALRKNPRPVLVGNPDLVAPYEGGLSLEPGFYAHDLADQTGCEPLFFGKPFGNVFDLLKTRLSKVAAKRIAMVGDTLHTDILGGAAAGWSTVLITGHGLLKTLDAEQQIAASAIRPDFIAATT